MVEGGGILMDVYVGSLSGLRDKLLSHSNWRQIWLNVALRNFVWCRWTDFLFASYTSSLMSARQCPLQIWNGILTFPSIQTVSQHKNSPKLTLLPLTPTTLLPLPAPASITSVSVYSWWVTVLAESSSSFYVFLDTLHSVAVCRMSQIGIAPFSPI